MTQRELDRKLRELSERAGDECKALRILLNGNRKTLNTLTTDYKTTIVGAINELNSKIVKNGTDLFIESITDNEIAIKSSTGNSVKIGEATVVLAGLLTALDKAKLDSISEGATQNNSDSYLLDRGNHTGTQTSDTISDFESKVNEIVGDVDVDIIDDITASDNTTYSSNKINTFFDNSSPINGYEKSNWDTAFGWGNHASVGYLTSFTETDPVFTASQASSITATNIANWNTAFGWGDHSTVGYLTTFSETDPVFTASAASNITSGNIGNWNDAYSWGDHSLVGYLTSYMEIDPIFTASEAASITASNKANWNTAFGWGDHATIGYLTSYTETDPIFTASPSASITASLINEWNTAYDDNITNVAVTGTNTKTLTLTQRDGSTVTTTWTDLDTPPDGDEYVDALSFNSTSGVLSAGRTGALPDITTSLDGRYSLLGHNHVIGDITDFSDNSTNWNTAFGWGDHSGLYSLLGHTHTEADITDLQDYLLSVDVSDINATGTTDATTYLRGDGSWATVAVGGGVWGTITGTLTDQTDLVDKFNEYLPLTGGTVSGDTTVTSVLNVGLAGATGAPIRIYGQTEGSLSIGYLSYYDSVGTRLGYAGFASGTNGDFYIRNDAGVNSIRLLDNGGANGIVYDSSEGTNQKIWHQGNDGAGSGLDADLLDGVSWGNVNTTIKVDNSNAIVETVYTGGTAVSRIGTNSSGGYWLGKDQATDTTSIIRSYGVTELHGGQVISYNGGFAAVSSADNATLFSFSTERPWVFKQGGTGAGTSLDLIEPTGSKLFKIGTSTTDTKISFSSGTGNITSVGYLEGKYVVGNSISSNSITSANECKVDGYGLMGNRSNIYITNGASTGTIRLGQGGIHNINTVMEIQSSKAVMFGTKNLELTNGAITRKSHNSGHLEGSYNNVGSNSSNTNPIYTIGSSYNPNVSDLANMYGIGFASGNAATYLNSTELGTNPTGWGMYVASDGNARIFLDAQFGITRQSGAAYASNFILNSDIRRKNNVEDYSPSEMNVEWKSFELKSEKGVPRVGVSAQQLLENHPEFVEQTDTENYTVRYIDLLCAKMAEKDKQIKSLEERLERLEKLIK